MVGGHSNKLLDTSAKVATFIGLIEERRMDRRSADPSVRTFLNAHGRRKIQSSAARRLLCSKCQLFRATEMKQFPEHERTEVAMDADYMLACGIVWRKTADPDAGWELVEALASPDRELRQFARDMLIQRRDDAMALLEDAVGSGVLAPEVAGPCMVELLRAGTSGSSDLLVTSEA